MLAEPMVLNIDYVSGSFEVDPKTRERLKSLARILVFADQVNIEINGYTDNIGLATANRKLSEKRANRVRDFLASQGVAEERMKVFGRGETNFVASNETAAGRAKNRRVELIFYF
jgi:outer membrane protein OmpA-like peptidoglycan-associated protein